LTRNHKTFSIPKPILKNEQNRETYALGGGGGISPLKLLETILKKNLENIAKSYSIRTNRIGLITLSREGVKAASGVKNF